MTTFAIPCLALFGACSAAWLGDVAWPWVPMTLLGLFAVIADAIEDAPTIEDDFS